MRSPRSSGPFKPDREKARRRAQGRVHRAVDDGPLRGGGGDQLRRKAALPVFLSEVDASEGWVSARAWLDP